MLQALRAARPGALQIRSDSQYLVNALHPQRGWIRGWRARGWMTSKNEPVANRELFETLAELIEHHDGGVELVWVRGHNGEAGNERVDELARAAAERARRGDTLIRRTPIDGSAGQA